MVNSSSKGKKGERELAGLLRSLWGIEARRSEQYCGKAGDADLQTSLERLHIECKRTERLSLYKAMEQAKSDCKADQIPLVMHRPSRKPWVVVVELEDLLDLVEYLFVEVVYKPEIEKSKTDFKSQKIRFKSLLENNFK